MISSNTDIKFALTAQIQLLIIFNKNIPRLRNFYCLKASLFISRKYNNYVWTREWDKESWSLMMIIWTKHAELGFSLVNNNAQYFISEAEGNAEQTRFITKLAMLWQTLAEGCQKESATKLMLSTVIGLGSDAVPNVKFNVAKTLMRIGQWLDTTSIQQQVKPVLEKLKQDPDTDVQHFALEAMESEYWCILSCVYGPLSGSMILSASMVFYASMVFLCLGCVGVTSLFFCLCLCLMSIILSLWLCNISHILYVP